MVRTSQLEVLPQGPQCFNTYRFTTYQDARRVRLVDPGKSTGKELSPKVKEIEPSGFQQNVRLEILQLAPQEQNLGQPRF